MVTSAKHETITVPGHVYARMHKLFEAHRGELAARHGITSMSAYVSHMILTSIEGAAEHPRFDVLKVEPDLCIIQDRWAHSSGDNNSRGSIAEVRNLAKRGYWCYMCRTENCPHIGFAFAQPGFYYDSDDAN